MEAYNGNFFVAAVCLAVITLYFPCEGKKALLLENVKGAMFFLSCVLLLVILWNKFPELGWNMTSGILAVLSAGSFLLGVKKILFAIKDLYCQPVKKVVFAESKLKKGESGSTYLIGKDKDGKKYTFRIRRKTFWYLMDQWGKLEITYYPSTKIILQINVIRSRSKE